MMPRRIRDLTAADELGGLITNSTASIGTSASGKSRVPGLRMATRDRLGRRWSDDQEDKPQACLASARPFVLRRLRRVVSDLRCSTSSGTPVRGGRPSIELLI